MAQKTLTNKILSEPFANLKYSPEDVVIKQVHDYAGEHYYTINIDNMDFRWSGFVKDGVKIPLICAAVDNKKVSGEFGKYGYWERLKLLQNQKIWIPQIYWYITKAVERQQVYDLNRKTEIPIYTSFYTYKWNKTHTDIKDWTTWLYEVVNKHGKLEFVKDFSHWKEHTNWVKKL